MWRDSFGTRGLQGRDRGCLAAQHLQRWLRHSGCQDDDPLLRDAHASLSSLAVKRRACASMPLSRYIRRYSVIRSVSPAGPPSPLSARDYDSNYILKARRDPTEILWQKLFSYSVVICPVNTSADGVQNAASLSTVTCLCWLSGHPFWRLPHFCPLRPAEGARVRAPMPCVLWFLIICCYGLPIFGQECTDPTNPAVSRLYNRECSANIVTIRTALPLTLNAGDTYGRNLVVYGREVCKSREAFLAAFGILRHAYIAPS